MERAGNPVEVHEALARALVHNDATTMFGVMGDGNIHVIDSFVHRLGGRYVAATCEAGAVLMALGHASVAGCVGLATVTHGPGLSNAVTALIEGVKGRLPLLVLAGDTAREDREHSQDIAQRELVIATGAGFEPVRAPGTVAEDVARALWRAVVERRPIVLNLSVEFTFAATSGAPVRVRHPERRGLVPESEEIDNAVGMIAAARKPVILAGRGAVAARAPILALAKRCNAMLATTLKAKDLFAGEEADLGIFGTLSSPAAAGRILESDCIVAFGASLARRTTSSGAFLRGKRLIQCNAEPDDIGRNAAPDAALVGDPGLVADRLRGWLDEAGIETASVWEMGGFAASHGADASRELPPFLREAMLAVERAVPPNRILATDGGRFAAAPRTCLRVEEPRLYVQNWSSGAIGFGVASAIGAAFADRGRPVLLVIGDGGLMLGGIAEINTAVRYGIDLTIVVCNDGAYGSEHEIYRLRGEDPALSLFAWPSFAAAAKGVGAAGLTVASPADLAGIQPFLRERGGVRLIDLRLDVDAMPSR